MVQKVWSNKPIVLACLQAMIDVLGLDICADTIIGNAMRRGVSGGQKKRVTTGASLPMMCMSWDMLRSVTGPKVGQADTGLAQKAWRKDSFTNAGILGSGLAYVL